MSRRFLHIMASILVVDNSIFMRNFVGDMLHQLGHKVIAEASNGEEAVEQYQKHTPDLVTMDITMEKMSGIDALRAIKRINPEAKIIMCSSIATKSNTLEALKEGAVDFIVKPIELKQLIKSLNRAGLAGRT